MPQSRVRTPVVTILLPCRRPHAAFLCEALRSVIAQSNPQWRLCIILDPDDPAARGETEAALDSLGVAGDPRIARVINEGRFITGAFNTGMRHATTPYVCVLHGDDLLARRAVAVLTRAVADHPEIDYFHSSRQYIDHDGTPLSAVRKAVTSFTLADFVQWGPVKALHCWRVTAALAIGGMDEALGPHGADDYDFPWLMAEAGYAFRALPECLYYYRDHREHYRLTTHVPLETQLAELRKILAKHGIGEPEIERQLRIRSEGYLRQALYRTEADASLRELEGYDIRQGWRQAYPDP